MRQYFVPTIPSDCPPPQNYKLAEQRITTGAVTGKVGEEGVGAAPPLRCLSRVVWAETSGGRGPSLN